MTPKGLAYLQSLKYHGILGTVPGFDGHRCALPSGTTIDDARDGTITVERVKWDAALLEFAALTARVAELEALNSELVKQCHVYDQHHTEALREAEWLEGWRVQLERALATATVDEVNLEIQQTAAANHRKRVGGAE